MSRTITAYFDTHSDAQLAGDRLREMGVPPTDVIIHDATATEETSSAPAEHKGFLASISDFFMPRADRDTYAEGIRRGGSVLTVKAQDADFDRVSDILEETAVDLDSRESEWRADGWSGYDANATATEEGVSTTGYADSHPGEIVTGRSASDRTPETGVDDAAFRADSIHVAEEKPRVGRREVDHGRARIRSYVVDTPATEDVSLRDETVRRTEVEVDDDRADRSASGYRS